MTELPMIKLSDVLDLVKPLDQYEHTTDANISDFELDLNTDTNLDYAIDAWNECNIHMRQVPINTWVCTDTEVGVYGYFFDGRFVALSFQEGRKCDTTIMWASIEDAHEVYNFMRSLAPKELPEVHVFKRDDDVAAWWLEPQE